MIEEILLEIAEEPINKYYAAYKYSRYRDLRSLPSSTKGSIVEKAAIRWFQETTKQLTQKGDKGCDFMSEGIKYEVKASFLWAGGYFKFQQIRPKQDYDYVLCVGISDDVVYIWNIPKDVIMSHATPQHGGQAGKDILWLQVDIKSIPSWLDVYRRES